MDFTECVQTRRSVRRFGPRAVPRDALEKLVAAASCAPSWKNTQTARYIAVTDPELKSQIAQNGVPGFTPNQNTIESAPCLVLITTVTARSGFERDGAFSTAKGTHWESFDAGIATQTFCLAAHNAGLATVILGIFNEDAVAKLAGIPQGQKLSAMVALGCADETPAMPKRKTVEELLTYV